MPPRRWRRGRGGELAGERLAGDAPVKRLQFAVLNSPAACAYAWPDGHVFVTRGLAQALDDEELAAAVAHELGHLLNDGHLAAQASLRGCWAVSGDPAAGGVEARADATGAALLRLRGIPADAMPLMLRALRATGRLSPACAAGIGPRLARLVAPRRAVAQN